jgi:copper(I)-binding protein
MDTESVVLGKWDNHGNKMNIRLSAQNSQKVDTEAEIVLKHGNKHIMTVETTGDLKKALEYTAMREVEGLTLEKAYEAVELYNSYHKIHMDSEEAIKGWKLENKIKS